MTITQPSSVQERDEDTGTEFVDSLLMQKRRKEIQSIAATYEDLVLRVLANLSLNATDTAFYRPHGRWNAAHLRAADQAIIWQRFWELAHLEPSNNSSTFSVFRTQLQEALPQTEEPIFTLSRISRKETPAEARRFAGLPEDFKKARQYVSAHKNELLAKYEGKYIAVWHGAVIDTHSDFSSLARRVYDRLGYIPVYMPLITKARRVIRLPSARVRPSSKEK